MTSNEDLHENIPALRSDQVAPRPADKGLPTDDVVERLKAFASRHAELKFSGDEGRNLAHDIVQYPAMMVPNMQGGLIDCFRPNGDDISVVDPFMGSGTILIEAQRRGLPFTGLDINPYAYLIALVKSTRIDASALQRLHNEIQLLTAAESSNVPVPGTDWCKKWFRDDVSAELARLQACIKKVATVEHRRLLWVCLGETVRVSSNSRTSTFKLHVRTEADRARKLDVKDTFLRLVKATVLALTTEAQRFPEPGAVTLRLGDIRHDTLPSPPANLLISSPPYGDNTTTVPYGQFSFLALQWIDRADIHSNADDAIQNTHALDTRSLGGAKKGALLLSDTLRERSPTLGKWIDTLSGPNSAEGQGRVLAFYRDMNTAMERCVGMVKRGGYMVWTVGNRRVHKTEVQMHLILTELAKAHGCTHVHTMKRVIPSKRMAVKNSFSETMKTEWVVVVRNG